MTTERDSYAAKAVLAADDRRRAASLAGDADTLERLFTDDFTFVHNNGVRDKRDQYLTPMRKGVMEYLTMDRVAADVRVYGDWALVDGDARVVVRAPKGEGGALYDMRTVYLAAWTRQDGEWRLAAYSSTPVKG